MRILGWEIIKRNDGRYLRRSARHPSKLAMRSGFKAAESSLLLSKWSKQPIPINEHLKNELTTLRARSRVESINNPYHKRFVGLARNNVVGPNGVVFQSRVTNRDGTPDQAARKAIEESFARWCEPANCTMSGTLDFIAVQNCHIGTVAEDGEALWMLVYGKQAGEFGVALHQVDIDLLDIELNYDLKDGNRIRLGIEIDQWNRPQAYYLKASEYSEHPWVGPSRQKYQRVPAGLMFHDFLRERPNQLRGVPWGAAALVRLRQLDAYEDAAVVAARIGAGKMGAITSPSGEYAGEEEADPVTGDAIMSAEPGSWFNLEPGQEIQSWDPTYPHEQFGDFVKAQLRGGSAAYNVDYPSLSGDLEGVNFSSIRAGVLETREGWKALQGWMARGFLTWVYRNWLEAALAKEMIIVPGRTGQGALSIENEEKYRRCVWQGRRWAWVDPLKDMQAAKMAIDERLRSRSEVMRDMTGRDADDVWSEIEADESTLAKKKIPAVAAAPAAAAPAQEPNPEQSDED